MARNPEINPVIFDFSRIFHPDLQCSCQFANHAVRCYGALSYFM